MEREHLQIHEPTQVDHPRVRNFRAGHLEPFQRGQLLEMGEVRVGHGNLGQLEVLEPCEPAHVREPSPGDPRETQVQVGELSEIPEMHQPRVGNRTAAVERERGERAEPADLLHQGVIRASVQAPGEEDAIDVVEVVRAERVEEPARPGGPSRWSEDAEAPLIVVDSRPTSLADRGDGVLLVPGAEDHVAEHRPRDEHENHEHPEAHSQPAAFRHRFLPACR